MSTSREDALRAMLARKPDDPFARFGLANELLKREAWAEAVEELTRYLEAHTDEGNAYGGLATALLALGRTHEAREALQLGIDRAQRHNHPDLAADFSDRLGELEESA